MNAFILEFAKLALWNLVYLVIGYILAFPIRIFESPLCKISDKGTVATLLLISLSSFSGLMLPLSVFGVIPILATCIAVGIKYYQVLPMLLSNIVFNMLMPRTEIVFSWEFARYRMLCAFLMGFIFGLLLYISRIKASTLVQEENLNRIAVQRKSCSGLLSGIGIGLNSMGLYVVAGAFAKCYFDRYIFFDMITWLYQSPVGPVAMKFFMSYNVTNTYFILASILLNLLLNFLIWASILVVFRIRGVLAYFVYFSTCIAILSTSIFFI